MPVSPVQSAASPSESSSHDVSDVKWYFAFFVISGFCGLVYEVIWVRLAMASFGVTTALVSIVLSLFMAGMGLGAWGAGALTRTVLRGNRQRALWFYCIAELLIGSSAFMVPKELELGREFMLHMGSLGSWQSSSYYLVSGIWIAIALVPWCTFLGATYPLLMAVIRQGGRVASDRSFSYLYVANVIGALLGTLASAFVLIELLGFQRTLYVGAILNIVIALLALRISLRMAASPSFEPRGSKELPESANLYGLHKLLIPILLFTTGLVSMGAEVVWMRQFTPYLGNFVYAFAAILATYLLGTFMGARDYRNWATSHPLNQSATTWTLLAFSTLIPVACASPGLLPSEFGEVRILSILFFCALTGFLTPLLVDSWSGGEAGRAGTAYAFNILGCIVGPLLASFWLEPWLGERWSTFALAMPLFAVSGIISFCAHNASGQGKTPGHPKMKFIVAFGMAILLVCLSDDYESIYKIRKVRRDYAATVIATGTGWERTLLVNGVGMTGLTPITKYIADLPLASMRRPPRNGLVICFGMGTTFRSMLSWGIPTTSVDLIPSVPKLFDYFHADAPQLEKSPLAKIVIDDGRRFLDGSSQQFDVIVVDPPPPVAAPGSSLLYSREFYDVIKRHLSSDGIFQTWYPSGMGDDQTTASVTKALMHSFPYVRAFYSYDGHFGIHFLASMKPLRSFSAAELAARMPPAAVSDFVEFGPEISAEKEFDLVLKREVPLQTLIQPNPSVPELSDDQPINEYFVMRKWFHASR
jgi:spermidine synthase